ncbi:beta-ketoacyl-ACP synthase II [Parachlamydia sp. AcF125]|uniref:beta-ketoacyl-ACP synthase II n=1 Tax=Parachlamydia sp. AcF125 TaxID=2795736 RepID=UPI001BCA2D22|nr:beta-ketoacyl-ACP synthase II [Parachlamydia sp. AcF125]MBS4168497.1 3-oxoacyl-[acyl-carrier-protein] synthase 2 [Parachlamydia sp. AcF125]
MNKKRIVVTGMGIISCLGHEVDLFYQNLLLGKSGIAPITGFPCEEYPTRFAGEIKEFDPGEYIDKKQARRIDKFIAYTIVAGKKALELAGLSGEKQERLDKERCGIIIGSGMGGMEVFVDGVQNLFEKGYKKVSPFFVPYIITNMGGGLLAKELGFMGPNYSISTACATGNHSIIAAASHIRSGEVDLMLCGGAEATVLPIGIAGFCACKALSERNEDPTKASRPWDKDRDGFVLGEGAGVLVLESLEHALARGAPIYAEYLGGSSSCDAHHITEPRADGKGVAVCIKKALKDAEVLAEDINYVNAHATSTPAGDMAEVNALKQVLPHPSKVVMNATKSLIGHCLGAAGGVEAIVTVKAIAEGKVHPTLNLENPEPGLDFYVPKTAEELSIKVALSNSFGFGGHNATLVFGPYHSNAHG